MLFPGHLRLPGIGVIGAAMGLASALAAQPAPDLAALQQQAASAPAAEKSAALTALSRALEAEDMTRAADAARQARAAATNPHDELVADARLATILRRRGDYVEAMSLARTGLGRATELGDNAARLDLLLVFAQINGSIADLPAAMEAYQQLTTLAERTGNRYMAARGHLGFSIVFSDTGEVKRARDEEELVVRIARELGNRELEADGLNNLGNNLRAAGEFGRAREAHAQALAIRQAAGNRRGEGDSLVNLGEVARARGDFPAALDFTQRALAVYEQLGLKRYQANARVQLAAILRALHRPDEALDQLNQGAVLAAPLQSHRLVADYQHEYSLVFEAKGDSRAALEAQRRYSTESEAALGEKALLQIATLKARYDAERHDRELAQLRATQTAQAAGLRATASALGREQKLRTVLIDSLVVLVVLGGSLIILRRYATAAKRRRSPAADAPTTPSG